MMMQVRTLRESRSLLATGPLLVFVSVLLAGVFAGCGGKETTGPTQAPVVQVLTPNGGEVIGAGTPTAISWTAVDADTPASSLSITIEFSRGGGAWLPVATGESNDGTFTWAVPTGATGQALIRVTATDGANQGSDVSNAPFSITPSVPVVRVLAPNGGEAFLAGAQTEITWTATDADTPASLLRINLEFNTGGGAPWVTVALDESNDGTFTWAVPEFTSGQALIRVTATDGENAVSDVSDGPFSISSTPPPPRNTIAVGEGSAGTGAVVEVPLSLQNQDTAGLIETRVVFDPAVADFQSVQLTGRGTGMRVSSEELGADTVLVTVQQQNGVVIPVGDGPVALLAFRLVGAAGTRTDLRLREPRLLDAAGVGRAVNVQNGSLVVVEVTTPEALTAQGWAAFEAGNLAQALQHFDAALTLDPQYGPAFTGRGWVQLSQATTNAAFQAAASSFDSAVGYGQTGADARGGRAAARLALGGSDLVGAVQEAQTAVTASPTFVFSHRTTFDYRDLRLIAAFAEAGRGGRFSAARDEADQVQASDIRAGDFQTWTVDGVHYPSFEAAVLAWLQKLSAAFAG